MKTLRPYQIEDVEFLIQHDATACFNEQRTGKTPTALATIVKRGLINERVLIITTNSAIFQWCEEWTTWLHSPCPPCVGTTKKKKQIINEWTNGLVVSIDSFKSTARSEGLVNELLKLKPKLVILDEAHKIKNPTSAAAKAVFKTKSVPYRLALTGTPAPGKAHDIYSILHWLYPDLYTSKYKFMNEYFIPIPQQIFVKGRLQQFTEYLDFKPEAKIRLQSFLSQIATQRKRKDVMPWLPDKDYQQIKIPATTQQKRYLEELFTKFHTEDLLVKGVLDRLIRYRQICLDPGLLGLPGTSPKTEYIMDYLSDNPETPVLIFSAFTEYLFRLFDEIKGKYGVGMIVGEVSPQGREMYRKDFQDGKYNVLLINIAAGKEALTLDRAETIIFTDKYPPIGDILQAEDRFVATTESKADKPHTIIELMITDSFDEDIYTMLSDRKVETDIINNFKKQLQMKGVKNE